MIVAFTGHRPDKLPNKETGYTLPNPMYNYVCQEIEKALKELKPEKAIIGMAIGVDQWAANICIKLGIPFVAAVPFRGQESKWPSSSQKIYKKLLDKASEIVVLSSATYAAGLLQRRNEWMVDNCDKLIAVFDGSAGGTGNCVNYAKKVNKEIYLIDPKNIGLK